MRRDYNGATAVKTVAPAAVAYQEAGHAAGKVVLAV